MSFRIGVDVGGTFTDFLVVDDSGRLCFHKTPTTPEDPSIGLLNGLGEIAASLGLQVGEFARNVSAIVHGMTVATNAVLTRRGAKTGLLTTEGFRDVLEMRRGYREKRYDNKWPQPKPLVRRHLRRTVRGRLDPLGNETEPLDLQGAAEAIEFLEAQGVESVAICFMHSYANAAHEQRVASLVRERLPGRYLSVSSSLLPQVRIWERVSTTVLNSYVGPVVARYLGSLGARLEGLGFAGVLLVMQSNGGITSLRSAIDCAASTLLSGPAGGPVAGTALTAGHGWNDIVTMDMGGTSFDTALIKERTPVVTAEGHIDGLPVALPMLDIHTIGAGGGSIGWVDAGGILHVGPQSAGASPGPACYGLGGTEPTCTDADVVLGYLDPDYFLGGRMKLDRSKAEEAIRTRVAGPLGLSVRQAALGMFELINVNMAAGTREVCVRRGCDPRDFPLVVAGGAGPIHCGFIALELGIPSVFVPRLSSVFCAAGMLLSDFRHDHVRTFRSLLAAAKGEEVVALFREMTSEGRRLLAAEGVAPQAISELRSMELRYLGQHHEVAVPVEEGEIEAPFTRIAERFHRRHEQLYGYSSEASPVELISLRVASIGRTGKPSLGILRNAASGKAAALKGRRPVYLHSAGDFAEVDVYDGDRLGPESRVPGPAVVEMETTTLVVPSQFVLSSDSLGNFIMKQIA
jgi:N-methylhydantoinase A